MSVIDEQAMAWLLRRAAPGFDDQQQQDFDAWYAADIRHQGAFLRATAIHAALEQAGAQQALRPGRSMADAPASAPAAQPVAPRFTRRHLGWALGGLAAGVAAMGVVGVMSGPPQGDAYSTAQGEFRKVTLADHSVASINSDSALDVVVTRQQRRVSLHRGEAWFEVARDKSKPFVVDAGELSVRALGTAFSVRRHATGAEVLVTEGLVEVWSNASESSRQRLGAGERAFVAQHGAQVSVARQPAEIERKLAWREGKLIFQNETLAEAVADFNRYSRRALVIVDPDLARRTLVGQYRIDAPELFARDVGTFLGVPVVVTGEQILIGGNAAAGTSG